MEEEDVVFVLLALLLYREVVTGGANDARPNPLLAPLLLFDAAAAADDDDDDDDDKVESGIDAAKDLGALAKDARLPPLFSFPLVSVTGAGSVFAETVVAAGIEWNPSSWLLLAEL